MNPRNGSWSLAILLILGSAFLSLGAGWGLLGLFWLVPWLIMIAIGSILNSADHRMPTRKRKQQEEKVKRAEASPQLLVTNDAVYTVIDDAQTMPNHPNHR